MRGLLVSMFVCFSVPAAAQSSLGITGADLSFGVIEDESGASRVEGAAVVDVAVTEVHGFQGDLWFATDGGASRYDGMRFYNLTRAEGLPGDEADYLKNNNVELN